MSGRGLELRFKIRQLQRQHNVVTDAYIVPLLAPVDHDMILEGFASTTDRDLDRCQFRAYAFTFLPWAMPKLLYRHDETQVAGQIQSLHYDAKGNLKIRAHVTHPEGRRCGAFSIGGKVIDYEIRSADTADFHALVTRADLTEISLTDCPSNVHALVTHRYRPSAAGAFYDIMKTKVARLSQLAKLMQQELRP